MKKIQSIVTHYNTFSNVFCVITPTLKKEFSETIKEYYFFMFIVLTSKTNVYTFIIKSRENINKKINLPEGKYIKKVSKHQAGEFWAPKNAIRFFSFFSR